VVRAAALLTGALLLAVYTLVAERLPASSDWWDVAVLAFFVIPLTFLLVWIALPLHAIGPVRLAVATGVAVVCAVATSAAELQLAANFCKLAAATLLGWLALSFFEESWWVPLIAVLIVPVDLYSVAMGPTREITQNRPEVFDALSIFMRVPGESSTAQLGLPDVLFFALFLGACGRFGLRTAPTWAAMTASFGATLALAVALGEAGIAALPLLSLAFVCVNADLLWRQLRGRDRDGTVGGGRGGGGAGRAAPPD
jgi:hypothetical protein